jgi:hypothetical protein
MQKYTEIKKAQYYFCDVIRNKYQCMKFDKLNGQNCQPA